MKSDLIILIVLITAVIGLFIFLLLRKKTNTLVIIGNGFDLYHGIYSSYIQFREYLKQTDREVFNSIEKYLHIQENAQWNNLEINLANLDGEDLLDEMKIFIGDHAVDWKDAMNDDFQYEVGKVTESLGEEMKKIFLKWILSLKITHVSGTPRLQLPRQAQYLNFNYTGSLEKLYGIPPKNILYIHGKAKDETSEIVLGHGWEAHEDAMKPGPVSYEDFVDGNYATETDWKYEEAKAEIERYFANSFKDARSIINKNKSFFRHLKSIKRIYVLGHSMSQVDIKYFEAIAKECNTKKVKWIVSYYRIDDIQNCETVFQQIGIDLKLVEFKRMEDLFPSQLSLFPT